MRAARGITGALPPRGGASRRFRIVAEKSVEAKLFVSRVVLGLRELATEAETSDSAILERQAIAAIHEPEMTYRPKDQLLQPLVAVVPSGQNAACATLVV